LLAAPLFVVFNGFNAVFEKPSTLWEVGGFSFQISYAVFLVSLLNAQERRFFVRFPEKFAFLELLFLLFHPKRVASAVRRRFSRAAVVFYLFTAPSHPLVVAGSRKYVDRRSLDFA
jgi:hypothetical protein